MYQLFNLRGYNLQTFRVHLQQIVFRNFSANLYDILNPQLQLSEKREFQNPETLYAFFHSFKGVFYLISTFLFYFTTCPKDWIQFQESCYFFNNFNSPWKTWDQSRQLCQTMKSDLVVISSHEEQVCYKMLN
uniref:C-type lectin domain-containing protein n=1 Tax=Oryzias sinensis TaxID=183150 RepID=A0A8C7YB74_9TELE